MINLSLIENLIIKQHPESKGLISFSFTNINNGDYSPTKTFLEIKISKDCDHIVGDVFRTFRYCGVNLFNILADKDGNTVMSTETYDEVIYTNERKFPPKIYA